MVESILSFSRLGLRDWLWQRVSAVIVAAYVIFLGGFWVCHANLTFAVWAGFLTSPAMAVFSLLALVSLLIHAWIGMWTVLTDYISNYALRLFLEVVVIFTLIGYFAWGIEILWSL